MRNRVYFGTYSLEHWMNLLRKGNIVLPKYQRHFVWEKERVDKLVESIKENLFIPPVTIGSFQEDGKLQNLILDGQQRLTSVLLAYLGLYPDKEHYRREADYQLAGEDAGLENEDMEAEENTVIKWNVQELFGEDNSYDAIRERALKNGHYIEFEPTLDETHLKNSFLGFSYLVPESKNPIEMQKYFSSVFRSVNYTGVNLLPQESRKALYYLDRRYEEYFAPEFCNRITVENKKTKGGVIMDFTRALALLASYYYTHDYEKVGKRYGRKLETYYEHYIESVVSGRYEDLFGKFSDYYTEGDFKKPMERLQRNMRGMKLYRHFESIIYIDVYTMGLIYHVLFLNHDIDYMRDDIRDELHRAARHFRDDTRHSRTPAALKYIRQRMEASINIYKNYVL